MEAQRKGPPPRPVDWQIRENQLSDGSTTYDIVSKEGVEIYAVDEGNARRLLQELILASDYYVPPLDPAEVSS